jgi:hypothetical protein
MDHRHFSPSMSTIFTTPVVFPLVLPLNTDLSHSLCLLGTAANATLNILPSYAGVDHHAIDHRSPVVNLRLQQARLLVHGYF